MSARPVVLIGLKSYLGHARTLAWFDELLGLVMDGRTEGLSLVVAPSATTLATLAPLARTAGVALAAQDCSRHPPGAWTGELSASLLAEVGVSHVEVGHIERRRLGDTDQVIAAKVRSLVGEGLTPIVCVGEDERSSPTEAAAESVRRLESALADVPRGHPVLVAYEPTWAIGASSPAPAAHVIAVANRLRAWLDRFPAARLVYGGAAGPGTYREIASAVDGLGLGRRVHDAAALAAVLDEMRSAGAPVEWRIM